MLWLLCESFCFNRELLDVPPKCQNNLTKAIEDGNMRTVRHLLDNGFDVNSTSRSQDNTTVSRVAIATYFIAI